MNNLYDKITSHESIWSLMYPDYVDFMPLEEQIIEIKTKELRDKAVAYLVWEWPGPDVNMYNKANYGITWAFTRKELIDYWKEKGKR
jgi:hypothetical protein